MPHPRFTAASYRIHRVVFRPDPNSPNPEDLDLVENITVQVLADDDTPMDILPLDLVLPPGLEVSLKAIINARLQQLEDETGWTKRPLEPV